MAFGDDKFPIIRQHSEHVYLAVRMGGLDRWLWIVLLLTWAAGVSSLTWEYRKVTWFLFGMIAAEAGLMRTGRRPAATAIAQSVFAARAHSGPLPAQSGAQMIQDIQTLPRLRRFV